MIKRWLTVVLMLLSASLLVAGCGIPQEEYDAVIAERDAAKTQVTSQQMEIQTLQDDLAESQNQTETLEGDVAEAQSQIESLQSSVSAAQGQLSSYKSDIKSLWSSYDKKAELEGYLLQYWAAAARKDTKTITEMTLDMSKYVDALGNAELSQLWKDAMNYAAEKKETEFGQSLSQLMLKTVELAEADARAINDRLNR